MCILNYCQQQAKTRQAQNRCFDNNRKLLVGVCWFDDLTILLMTCICKTEIYNWKNWFFWCFWIITSDFSVWHCKLQTRTEFGGHSEECTRGVDDEKLRKVLQLDWCQRQSSREELSASLQRANRWLSSVGKSWFPLRSNAHKGYVVERGIKFLY